MGCFSLLGKILEAKGRVQSMHARANVPAWDLLQVNHSTMTPKSIRSHLAPYSIFSKRRTTVAHAFASALAPSDEFDEKRVEAALDALGQKNLKQLKCVYCGELAQTWDHLENLVRKGVLNGYGHQIGNLVPCCRDCKSVKGGKPFQEYVETLPLPTEEKRILISRLKGHLAQAKPIDKLVLDAKGQEALRRFQEIQITILKLMEEADEHAQILREQRNG
jgi:hypothetical protein